VVKSAYYILKSELQAKILKHIVVTNNADYETISKHTGKNRITNLQSIESLVKHHLVNKVRTDPKNRRSKLTFAATPKGLWYAIANLNLDAMDIPMSNEELEMYQDYLKGVADKEGRKNFILNVAKLILRENLFDHKGELLITDRQKLFEYGIIMGLVASVGKSNVDAANFFNSQTVDSLKKIFTSSELTETRNRFDEFSRKLGLVNKEITEGLKPNKRSD
jgi:predicted transcriptional regulator